MFHRSASQKYALFRINTPSRNNVAWRRSFLRLTSDNSTLFKPIFQPRIIAARGGLLVDRTPKWKQDLSVS